MVWQICLDLFSNHIELRHHVANLKNLPAKQCHFFGAGRTVSAAVQIVPYGAVVAKACEYLNDAGPRAVTEKPQKPRGEKLKSMLCMVSF